LSHFCNFNSHFYKSDLSDGVEDETLLKIQTRYRSDFQHCINPIGIEVYDVINDESYVASVDNNADGKSAPEYNSAYYGFKCDNNLQTLGTDGNPLATCVDVKGRVEKYRLKIIAVPKNFNFWQNS